MFSKPFERMTFSQPAPTATLSMAPKFPGTLMLSQIRLNGRGFDNCFTLSDVGISNTPEIS